MKNILKKFMKVKVTKMHRSNDRYFYRVYGLNISSDIYLPELQKWKGRVDINIIRSTVPSELNETIFSNEYIKISKNEVLLSIEGIAKYYVKNGDEIIVEPDVHGDNNSVNLYLLGTALGTALLQRGVIPIHGSAMVIDGKCVLFTGNSGAGKSTLSSAFRKKGHTFLADDVSVVTINEKGIVVVQPAYPQQKLWCDSLIEMGDDINKLAKVYVDENKYVVPTHNEFSSLPAPLQAIFELKADECEGVEMTQLWGVEKLDILLKNIYRVEILRYLGIRAEYLKQCVNIAKDISFFRLVRPKEIFSIEEQIKLVENKLKHLV